MSLIPLDEPRGDGPTTPRTGPGEDTPIRRFLSGLKSALRAIFGAGSPADGQSGETAKPDGASERGVARAQAADRPAELPSGSASDSGRVELVSRETEDTLTVAVADNPDATISSDTWESVER